MTESEKPDPNAPTAQPPERASKTTTAKKPVRPGGPLSLIGTTLSGRYRIERLLGEGGMGAVYQAEHTHMRKRMAIKVLHPEMGRHDEVVRRFEREAIAAGHIEHPNVVTAKDFGQLEDGSFFLALEFVEGRSLRDVVGEGPLKIGDALHITRQIAAALSRAHSMGIVHRDLKPENVMLVDKEGDVNFVKVLDFGIAKVPVGNLTEGTEEPGQPILTRAGMVYGTPEYMAPEQALGQSVDNRADLYALGVMTYEMLTGKRPFDNESKVKLLGLQVTAPVPPMKTIAPDVAVPEEIEKVVLHLLAKDAGDRTSDAKALVEEMVAAVATLVARGDLDAAAVAYFNSTSTGPLVTPQPIPASAVHAVTGGTPPVSKTPRPQGEHDGKKVVLSIVIGTVGVAGAIALVAMMLKGGAGQQAAREGGVPLIPTSSVSAGTSADPPQTPEERVAEAQRLLAKGDYASAVESLKNADVEGQRVEVHRLRVQAYAKLGRWADAMRDAQELLSIKPDEAEDVSVRISVRDAAISSDKEGSELAFGMLEKNMGVTGLVDLFELAYGTSAEAYAAAATRASNILSRADVRARMPAPLLVNVDVTRAGKTCALKRHLEKAAADGDKRTLAILRTIHLEAKPAGGKKDPLACIRDDLPKTIAKLQERVK